MVVQLRCSKIVVNQQHCSSAYMLCLHGNLSSNLCRDCFKVVRLHTLKMARMLLLDCYYWLAAGYQQPLLSGTVLGCVRLSADRLSVRSRIDNVCAMLQTLQHREPRRLLARGVYYSLLIAFIALFFCSSVGA